MSFTKFLSSWSLQVRLVIPLLTAVVLIMTGVGFTQYYTSTVELEDAIQNKAQALAQMLVNISGSYITNYDLSALEKFVENSMMDHDVSYVVFYDDQGKPLTEKVKKPDNISNLLNINDQIKVDDKILGKVSLGFRTDSVAVARKKNLYISTAGITVAVVLVFFLLWFGIGNVTKTIFNISSELEATGKHLLDSAQEISSSSDELMAASTNQANFVERTAGTISEFDASLMTTNQNAQKSAALANGSETSVQKGQGDITELLESFTLINAANKKLNEHSHNNLKNLNEIVKVIERIGDQTQVINNIVFQTKLLSFNASVEAARAGEHGRGFSIVAEEVGKLAAMSGDAAKQISSLLEASIKRATELSKHSEADMLSITKEATTRIEIGAEKVKRVSEIFAEIATNIISTVGASREIATAVSEQATGISDINHAMNELSTSISQTKVVSEGQATLAAGLLVKSEQIEEIANELRSIVRGLQAANNQASAGAGLKAIHKGKKDSSTKYPRAA